MFRWFGGYPKKTHQLLLFLFINTGINRNSRNKWTYPDLVSARSQVLHSEVFLIPTFHQLLKFCEDEYCISDHPSDTYKVDSDYDVM